MMVNYLSQVFISSSVSIEAILTRFIFPFSSKYTSSNERVTTAHLCHICDVAPKLAPHCLACVLILILCRGLHRFPSRPLFDPNFPPWNWRLICSYFLDVFCPLFKLHSLFIGGHTFCKMHGMSADLREFIARCFLSRCSLSYYRAFRSEIYGQCVILMHHSGSTLPP